MTLQFLLDQQALVVLHLLEVQCHHVVQSRQQDQEIRVIQGLQGYLIVQEDLHHL